MDIMALDILDQYSLLAGGPKLHLLQDVNQFLNHLGQATMLMLLSRRQVARCFKPCHLGGVGVEGIGVLLPDILERSGHCLVTRILLEPLIEQSTTVDDDLGIATASIVFFRSLGQAFGVAIGGTVFQNEFDRNVKRFVGEGRIGGGFVVAGAEVAGAYGAIGRFLVEVVDAYRYVYADSLRTVWYVTMALTAVGGLSSLAVKNLSMDRGNRSKQAFKHEEKSKKVVTV